MLRGRGQLSVLTSGIRGGLSDGRNHLGRCRRSAQSLESDHGNGVVLGRENVFMVLVCAVFSQGSVER